MQELSCGNGFGRVLHGTTQLTTLTSLPVTTLLVGYQLTFWIPNLPRIPKLPVPNLQVSNCITE